MTTHQSFIELISQFHPPAMLAATVETTAQQGGLQHGLWDAVIHHFWAAAGGFTVGFIIALSRYILLRRKKRQTENELHQYHQLLYGPKWPARPLTFIVRRYQHVLVLGMGGVGKSALLKAIFSMSGNEGLPNPAVKTKFLRLYSLCHAVTWLNPSGPHADAEEVQRTALFNLDLNDASGQNPKALAQELMKPSHQLRPVTSVLLIVDLFAPPKSASQDVMPAPQFDMARIDEQLTIWSQQLLDMWMTSAGNTPRNIFLFINKSDLVSTLDFATIEQKAREKFRALENRLSEAAEEVEVTIIVGSARLGTGVPRLMTGLFASSYDLPIKTEESESGNGWWREFFDT